MPLCDCSKGKSSVFLKVNQVWHKSSEELKTHTQNQASPLDAFTWGCINQAAMT